MIYLYNGILKTMEKELITATSNNVDKPHRHELKKKKEYTLYDSVYACVHTRLLQSYPTLCCSPSGSSFHGILQARILD